MEKSADVSSDGSEPFRVRRYRRQHPGQPPAESTSLHSLGTIDDSAAGSDYILVQEAPEEIGFTAISENLFISDDAYIPAAQSDESLFDDPNRTGDSEAVPDSNALPLQDQFASSDRRLRPQISHVHSLGESLSAELESTLPFSVVLGPPSVERQVQTEAPGALLRSAWLTGRSSSQSRSRGPSLHVEFGAPKSPPVHALRATGEAMVWNPRPRPVPSSRGRYASYPSNKSLLPVPKASVHSDVGLQPLPKKAPSSILASLHAGQASALPGPTRCDLRQAQPSAPLPKQAVGEGSAVFLSSTSVHSMQWKKALLLWKDLALSIASASASITEILESPMCATLLEHLLRRISDTTALRYIATCTKVVDSLTALNLPLADPTQVQLLDGVFAMQRTFRRDPGVHSDNVLKALRWLVKAAILDRWPDLYSGLFSTSSWRALGPKRESVPLPLAFLLWLETCILFDYWSAHKVALAGAVLLCVYASLRFSDAQHIDFSSIVLDSSSLRAGSFRTKTSRWMPFGIYIGGLYGRSLQQSWVVRWLHAVESAAVTFISAGHIPDFIFMEFSDDTLSPMSYCSALGCLRGLLVEWGQISSDQLPIYTLHSMKCTLLSCYRQCDYPDDIRHLQGHHKALTSMRLYGRDDVSPCITQQIKFINTVRQGWRARTPLLRGVAFTAEEPALHFVDSSRFWHFRGRPQFFKMSSPSDEPSVEAPECAPVDTDVTHSQSEASPDCILEESESDDSATPSLGAADEVPLCISNAGLIVHVSLEGRPACGSQGTFHSIDSVPGKARLCKHKSCALIFAGMH